MTEEPIPSPAEGQYLLKHLYLSVDPFMRGRMDPMTKYSYAPGVEAGAVMQGSVAGRVIESKHPDYKAGDYVAAYAGWQEYSVGDGTGFRVGRIDPELAPVSAHLGVLGMPGMTAYFGLLEVGQPKRGETVFVTGGAGAVGSWVGQIAKIKGCRVVGAAGSDEKVETMTQELGFDAGFNYKTTEDYIAKLEELCPDGIDVFFDNAGGALSDAAFMNLNVFARVCVCGQISQYNLEKPGAGPRLLGMVLVRQIKVEGFLISRFTERYPEAIQELAQWLDEGKLRYRETIARGIENAPLAFIGMLRGQNIGKQIVQLAEDV